MRAHELAERLGRAMRLGDGSGKGGHDVMVLLDGNVLPIRDARWHGGYDCFVVEADLT